MAKAYFLSILVSTFIIEIVSHSIEAQLNREGIKTEKTKRTLSERVLPYIYLTIPFFNICLALVTLFKRKEILEHRKKEREDKGAKENG